MSERLGDGPLQEQYREKMIAVVETLDELFNGTDKGQERQTGFVLLVFPFGDADRGRVNYMSNGANRKDIVAMFKHQIARFEGQPDLTGTA